MPTHDHLAEKAPYPSNITSGTETTVHGESGIGESRILGALCQRLEAQGVHLESSAHLMSGQI
jgi:hypothetical protein